MVTVLMLMGSLLDGCHGNGHGNHVLISYDMHGITDGHDKPAIPSAIYCNI